MARRLAAVLGIVILLGLAFTLLYRVYRHHENAAPYVEDEVIDVRLGTVENAVKFARLDL